MIVTVSRKAHFNAAHRLFRPEWSDEKNLSVFGKCSHTLYHGHNYDLEVSDTGEIDPITGFVAFDHKNLNEQVPEFKTLNPTSENIVIVIWNKLRSKIDKKNKLSVTLYETPRNFVSYSGA